MAGNVIPFRVGILGMHEIFIWSRSDIGKGDIYSLHCMSLPAMHDQLRIICVNSVKGSIG